MKEYPPPICHLSHNFLCIFFSQKRPKESLEKMMICDLTGTQSFDTLCMCIIKKESYRVCSFIRTCYVK